MSVLDYQGKCVPCRFEETVVGQSNLDIGILRNIFDAVLK